MTWLPLAQLFSLLALAHLTSGSLLIRRDGRKRQAFKSWQASRAEERRRPGKELFVFGDDLSDNGADEEWDPYGFQPCSNGPNWADYVARRFFGPAVPLDSFKNLAYAGACSGLGNVAFPSNWSGLFWQVNKLTCLRKDPSPESLVLLQLPGAAQIRQGAADLGKILQDSLKSIRHLIYKGAKKILVLDVLDISMAPAFRKEPWAEMAPRVQREIAELNHKIKLARQEVQLLCRDEDVALAWLETASVWPKVFAELPRFSESFALPTFERLTERSQWDFAWASDFCPSTALHKLIADHAWEVFENQLLVPDAPFVPTDPPPSTSTPAPLPLSSSTFAPLPLPTFATFAPLPLPTFAPPIYEVPDYEETDEPTSYAVSTSTTETPVAQTDYPTYSGPDYGFPEDLAVTGVETTSQETRLMPTDAAPPAPPGGPPVDLPELPREAPVGGEDPFTLAPIDYGELPPFSLPGDEKTPPPPSESTTKALPSDGTTAGDYETYEYDYSVKAARPQQRPGRVAFRRAGRAPRRSAWDKSAWEKKAALRRSSPRDRSRFPRLPANGRAGRISADVAVLEAGAGEAGVRVAPRRRARPTAVLPRLASPLDKFRKRRRQYLARRAL